MKRSVRAAAQRGAAPECGAYAALAAWAFLLRSLCAFFLLFLKCSFIENYKHVKVEWYSEPCILITELRQLLIRGQYYSPLWDLLEQT